MEIRNYHSSRIVDPFFDLEFCIILFPIAIEKGKVKR